MTWQNILSTNAIVATEFDNLYSEIPPEKPKEYLEFNIPPLALVIAKLEAGTELTDIVEMLQWEGDIFKGREFLDVSAEHLVQADNIYKYFANKFTMRRLKNEHISQWMLAVEELCKNRETVNKENIKVLVTLPKFYNENRELEPLMKAYKSITITSPYFVQNFDEVVTFVKKIERRASRGSFNDYYWSTENGYLVKNRIEANNIGSIAWDYLSKEGAVRMRSQFTSVVKLQGYEYFVFQPSSQTEIEKI